MKLFSMIYATDVHRLPPTHATSAQDVHRKQPEKQCEDEETTTESSARLKTPEKLQ